jgi:peroxiredoxin Q/BCP
VESCGFRDKVEQFAQVDTVVVGISVDTLDLQQKFTDKNKLNFPLLADDGKTVTKVFGVLGTSGLATRKTFVIDKQGVLRKVYDKVTPANHPEEVLKYVKEELK